MKKNIVKGSYNKEEVKKIMDIYKENPQAGNTLMFDFLKKYVYHIMYSQYARYAESEDYRDEFIQSVVLSICEAMPKYDPDLTAPTTFFKPYIHAGFRNAINAKSGATAYYNNVMRQIRQLQDTRLKKGLSTTESDCIVEMPDISPVTIKHAFEMMYAVDNTLYLDAGFSSDPEENSKSTEIAYDTTPESVFFESEDADLIHKTIDTVLTSFEKDIVVLSYNLFTSNIAFLEEILKEKVSYSAIELFKANGQSGSQALASWGFSKKEILMFGGVSKENAEFFLSIMRDGGTPEEYERMMEIAEFIESDKYKQVFENYTKIDVDKFLKQLGYNKKDIKAKEEIAKTKAIGLSDFKKLSIEDLLRGRGFSSQDIAEFLRGKKPSQTKICIILGRNAAEVKSATSQAEMKLKRALKSVFPERANKADIHMAKLNEEEIAFTADAEDYANAFMDQLDAINL